MGKVSQILNSRVFWNIPFIYICISTVTILMKTLIPGKGRTFPIAVHTCNNGQSFCRFSFAFCFDGLSLRDSFLGDHLSFDAIFVHISDHSIIVGHSFWTGDWRRS